MQHHMPWELSNRDHIRCFLQLDGLLIDKPTSIVQDHVWVKRAILRLTFRRGTAK